jgi:hypothetical protein
MVCNGCCARLEPIFVHLPRTQPGAPAGATFGFTFSGGAEAYRWTFDNAMGFGPGDTRRFTFDFQLDSTRGAGVHQVRGFFSTDTTGAVALTVLP